MAGIIKAGTLTDGTNSVDTSTVCKGVAKVWVSFDGSTTTPTIKASHNVSSITDNGTGDYTINFQTAMKDANYVTAMNSYYGTANTTRQSGLRHNGQTTSSLTLVHVFIAANNGATLYDCPLAHVSVFGD